MIKSKLIVAAVAITTASFLTVSCGSDDETPSTDKAEETLENDLEEVKDGTGSMDMADISAMPADFYKNVGIVLGNNLVSNLTKKNMLDIIDREAVMEGLNDRLSNEAGEELESYSNTASELVKMMDSGQTPDQATVKDGSYAIGVLEAEGLVGILANYGLDANMDAKEISDGYGGSLMQKEMGTSVAEANQVVEKFIQGLEQQKHQGRIDEANAFFAENKKKEGVKETASGLQYKVLKAGSGPKPTATSTVRVHYHGTLLDGTVFDSSVDRGEPAEFPVNRVIPGWTEALQLMPVGSRYKLWIPQELGYGANPRPGGAIQPYQMLVFEVELLEIVK